MKGRKSAFVKTANLSSVVCGAVRNTHPSILVLNEREDRKRRTKGVKGLLLSIRLNLTMDTKKRT